MTIIIDDATISAIEKVVTGMGTGFTLLIGYMYKKGYIDILLSKLFTPSEVIHAVRRQNGNALEKLNMSDELMNAVKKQNGNAIKKLNMSDDIVKYLQVLAPGPDGTIDEEKAIESLHDCIRWNNRIIKK